MSKSFYHAETVLNVYEENNKITIEMETYLFEFINDDHDVNEIKHSIQNTKPVEIYQEYGCIYFKYNSETIPIDLLLSGGEDLNVIPK